MEKIEPGKYRHFKGGEYEVIANVTHSETEEPMVVYRALYGEGKLWVRPAAMWNEIVTFEGKHVPRFERILPVKPKERPICEISRRCVFREEPGLDLGLCGLKIADAEIVLKESSGNVYLTAEWSNDAPDDIFYAVTSESLVDFQISTDLPQKETDSFRERLISEGLDRYLSNPEDEKHFSSLTVELDKMIVESLSSHGIYMDSEE